MQSLCEVQTSVLRMRLSPLPHRNAQKWQKLVIHLADTDSQGETDSGEILEGHTLRRAHLQHVVQIPRTTKHETVVVI